MLLSLVIPTFNAAGTLARALDSVLAQQGADELELLVVDDCSSDDTLKVAEAFARQHAQVRVLQTATNGGPGVARNLGMDAARGDWIGFLDADDELAVGALAELLVHLAESRQWPQPPDMLAMNWRYAPVGDALPGPGEGREDLPLLQQAEPHAVMSAFLLHRIDPSVIYHLYRREFLSAHGIRFFSGYHEDVDFSFHALLCARSIQTVDRVLYLKWNQAGSIVNTLGVRHVHGYFDAIERMLDLTLLQPDADWYRAPLLDFMVNVAASRLARIGRAGIARTDSPVVLLTCLYQRLVAVLARMSVSADDVVAGGELETRYYKMFRLFMREMPSVLAGASEQTLLQSLQVLQRQSWSCFDLHHALFLAPDEIRTCCKRYFHRGEMKGDVVLLQAESQGQFRFSSEDILQAKSQLHRDINRNAAPQCAGCPFLRFADWGAPLEQGVKYLSLEYHSVCNMRCTYCSPTYYGGKKPSYDIAHTVRSLGEAHALDQCEYLVWGGGEPTLDAGFAKLAPLLADYAPHVRQRVITNATKYTPALADMMAQDRAFIVVSLDAGTEETFRAIRKFSGFDRVLKHLQRYSQAAAHNTIIKYIALQDNLAPDEVSAFIELMAQHDLLGANFQLSCDFRSENLSQDEIASIAWLYQGLQSQGARFVFVDDLVWQRLPEMTPGMLDGLRQSLPRPGVLADAADYPAVAVWGTGAQASLMMRKSVFLRETDVACFIDPRPAVIGTEFMGRPVYGPDVLQQNDLPVAIAAVQSAPFIFRALGEQGVAPERVITRLVL